LKNKLAFRLFIITVIFAFSSKQLVNAASFNHSDLKITGLINERAVACQIVNQEQKQGKVKFYNKKEGYGYIIDGTTGVNYAFDKSGCVGGYQPKQNDDVSFEIKKEKKIVKAINIKPRK
jgi:cold shock CspA family protein